MNLPIRPLLIAGLALICTLGFTPKHLSPAHAASSTSDTKRMMYYFYTYPDDVFHDYNSASAEEDYWWEALGGVLVNTNPIGGTLVARGYQADYYPHMQPPSIYLYAHYTTDQIK